MASVVDPMEFKRKLWPNVTFYKEQQEIIYSVVYNDETYVPAGNKLGKDFVSGFICLYFFLTRNPCRIVTTSAKADHLVVLWGEINWFISTCAVKLSHDQGGPLILNHQHIRKVVNGEECPISYLKGMVASPDTIAAMQGHHVKETGDGIPRTLFLSDESSSVPDDYKSKVETWANRMLILGNTWECTNFFYKGVKAGDKLAPDVTAEGLPRYYRKVIRIKAEQSPNVLYAQAELKAGRTPSNRMVIPGVKSWNEYQKNLTEWDELQRTVCLDAEFYEGKTIKLFPLDWQLRSKRIATSLRTEKRVVKAIGVDTAEGGDSTTMTAVDEFGIVEARASKTPDTNVIFTDVLAFMQYHNVNPRNVGFDAGGGGKQCADRLRAHGFEVQIIPFGGAIRLPPKRSMRLFHEKMYAYEEGMAYKNRRAQMYGELRWLMSDANTEGFAIPAEYSILFEEMAPIPLTYDSEGKLCLLPKNNRDPNSKGDTLVKLIGHSPDWLDSLVVAVHIMLHQQSRPIAGAM